ncbi:hypothetical protein BC332_30990 [Capsicum chinense]|nr:hypothetical protein BC332_30990 [Capsicum chinense]
MKEFVKKLDSQLQGHIAESSKKMKSHDSKLDDLGKKLDVLMKKLIAPQDGILGSAPRPGPPLDTSGSRPRMEEQSDNGWGRNLGERYFQYHHILDPTQKLEIAVLHLQGKAESWHFSYHINRGIVRWETFTEEICKRFEVSDNSKINLIGEFKKIEQKGTVDEYLEKFEELKTWVLIRNPTLSEEFFMELFIEGLKEEIRHIVKMLNPYSMSQAIDKARHQERLLNIQHKKERDQLSRGSYDGGSSGGYEASRGVSSRNPSNTLFEQRRAQGLYYKCGDKYYVGLQCKQKHLNTMTALEDPKQLEGGVKQLLKKGQAIWAYLFTITAIGNEEKEDIPEVILQEFSDVFAEPKTLPPSRSHDHYIPLKHDASPVNIKSYRELNKMIIKDNLPIRLVEDLMDELHGSIIFSKIDLRAGYHHIRMGEIDIYKTGFVTHLGHYEFKVMPFGLTNAPATFQGLMNHVFRNQIRKFVLIFFDDILVYSSSLEEHSIHLREVFLLLRKEQLFAKLSKCFFGQPQVEYLGHVITGSGVTTDPKKVETMHDWPKPTTLKALRGFLGLTGYYRSCGQVETLLKKWSFHHENGPSKSEIPNGTKSNTTLQQKGLTKLMGMDYEVQYKKWTENRMANALSRRQEEEESELKAMSGVEPTWMLEVSASYEHDLFAQQLITELITNPAGKLDYTLTQGIIRYKLNALKTSPFEALYGFPQPQVPLGSLPHPTHSPVGQYLAQRQHMLQTLKENLHQAQAHIKFFADKHRTDRELAVGDLVYLKLQPYSQASVVVRQNLKLSAKCYGPYKILKKIGTIAYQLALPLGSNIHPVFHISQLKKRVGPVTTPQQQPPVCDVYGFILARPVTILQRRIEIVNNTTAVKILVQWSNLGPDEVTWERLAFIGDAAPSLPISSFFFATYPEIDCGKLTDLCIVNVSTEKLSKVVVRHGLYNYLRRDSAIFDEKVKEFMIAVQQEKEMEFHGGIIKAQKVLTDIVESVMGAVFLDCGFDVNAFWVVSFFLTI